MTEHEFDRMIEQAAGRFERAVEHAAGQFERAMEAGANHLDRSLTAAWDGSNLFRWSVCGAQLLAGAGLLAAAKYFANVGQRIACFCCAGTGAVVLAAALLRIVLLRGN